MLSAAEADLIRSYYAKDFELFGYDDDPARNGPAPDIGQGLQCQPSGVGQIVFSVHGRPALGAGRNRPRNCTAAWAQWAPVAAVWVAVWALIIRNLAAASLAACLAAARRFNTSAPAAAGITTQWAVRLA